MSSLDEQLQAMTKERDELQLDYSRLFDQNIQLDQELKRERHKEIVPMDIYNSTIYRLGEAESERDVYKERHEQALNILAYRSQELKATRKAVQECEKTWSDKMEHQRKESEEMQGVIRAQVSWFMAALKRVVAFCSQTCTYMYTVVTLW